MNARRWASRARAAFPVILLVIAVALGVAGWRMLVWSTPTAPELNNQGYIMVYTSDPDASVDFEIHDLSDPPDAGPRGYRVWVSANVETEKTAVRWAVALGGDARVPPEGVSVSGTMPRSNASPGRSGGFGDISSPNEPAYFVNGVEWPGRGEGTEEGDGSVIFGTEPNKHVVTGSVLGGFSINLTVKVRGPLLEDVGEFLTLSTPTLGRNGFTPAHIGGTVEGIEGVAGQTGKRKNPRQFYHGKAGRQLLETLAHTWYEPKDLQVGFNGKFNQQLKGVRQETGTDPIAPFRLEWRDKDSLKVEASFRRPADEAKNKRWNFIAGVLVSLAASFLVWALELRLGLGRDPVAAHPGPPYRPD